MLSILLFLDYLVEQAEVVYSDEDADDEEWGAEDEEHAVGGDWNV
jgi:hypothetical protein